MMAAQHTQGPESSLHCPTPHYHPLQVIEQMAGGIVKDVEDMEKVVGMGQGDLFNGVLIEIEGTGSQKGGYDKNDDPIKIKPNELDKVMRHQPGAAHNPPPRSHRVPSPLLLSSGAQLAAVRFVEGDQPLRPQGRGARQAP